MSETDPVVVLRQGVVVSKSMSRVGGSAAKQELLFSEGLAWVILFIETGDGQDLDLRPQIIPGMKALSVKSVRWGTIVSARRRWFWQIRSLWR